jgi:toxin ParE1/3/4
VTAKRVIRLESARQDEREAVTHYAREAGFEIALSFREALREAYRAIADHPGAGSPRYADLLAIKGLRSRKLAGYPYLVFYVERGDHIDVWRVLHGQRDILTWLADGES